VLFIARATPAAAAAATAACITTRLTSRIYGTLLTLFFSEFKNIFPEIEITHIFPEIEKIYS